MAGLGQEMWQLGLILERTGLGGSDYKYWEPTISKLAKCSSSSNISKELFYTLQGTECSKVVYCHY